MWILSIRFDPRLLLLLLINFGYRRHVDILVPTLVFQHFNLNHMWGFCCSDLKEGCCYFFSSV